MSFKTKFVSFSLYNNTGHNKNCTVPSSFVSNGDSTLWIRTINGIVALNLFLLKSV